MTIKSLEQAFEAAEQTDEFWLEQASINLTDELERVMHEQGVSQSELARRLGNSRAYVNRVIHGHENLTVATLVKFGRALGKRINFYFSDRNARITVKEEAQQTSETNKTIHFLWGERPSTVKRSQIKSDAPREPETRPTTPMWIVRHG